ncbi:carboxypeptidase-like regulatory domain-containing protein [Fibrella forsythiae]|uniref:Carboxypeptidase regulatory-like domain-containing protein n=1 Tax=Fibrella forsythiae TaxID=2817061 RepID=A0ABS3JJQ9_9BACT|nr:carboxypeptidase-like regulatory domain-containing protein [Fibrella forsythiae]MBO0950239.1 carboxypeptidase regulatory-like domain-containing protein [Fibrella forsythiae]
MPQSALISIPSPCPESWEQMAAVSGGRHCELCQKTVHDLSTFSDRELANWLATYTGEAVCGRLRTDQLERRIQQVQVRSEQARNGGWVRWAVALVLGWQTARGQAAPSIPVPQPATIQPRRALVNSQRPLIRPEPVFYIKGQVVDEDGEPYNQIVVQHESAGVSVPVDSDGRFRLPVYADDQKEDSIRVGIIYSNRQYINVSTRQEQAPLLITVYAPVPSRTIVGGGLVVTRQEQPKRRSLWQFLTGKR